MSEGDKEEEPELKARRIEVPGESSSFGVGFDDKRLWFGNLDPKVTEYSILKMAQKFGEIRKMDFLYHKGGPDKGTSKGYCFVSFTTWETAEQARQALDGKPVLGRPMHVKWAQGSKFADPEEQERKPEVPLTSQSADAALATASMPSSHDLNKASSQSKIQAIEAKLRLMEETKQDFGIHQPIPANPFYRPPSMIEASNSRRGSRNAPYRRRQQGGGHAPRNRTRR